MAFSVAQWPVLITFLSIKLPTPIAIVAITLVLIVSLAAIIVSLCQYNITNTNRKKQSHYPGNNNPVFQEITNSPQEQARPPTAEDTGEDTVETLSTISEEEKTPLLKHSSSSHRNYSRGTTFYQSIPSEDTGEDTLEPSSSSYCIV